MQKFKSIGIIIVALIIGYNVFDYFRVKKEIRINEMEECSRKFRKTNPEIEKIVADNYCKCSIETLNGKYKGSNSKSAQILENEKAVMQNCFDKAKRLKKQ